MADSGKKQASKPQRLLVSGVSPDVGKATQFKPGQSGNPAGKPKGTKNLSTRIQELLSDEEFTTWLYDPRQGLVEFKGAPMDAMIQALVRKAIGGDDKAFDKLALYGYGRKVELAGSVGIRVEEPKVVSKIAERTTDAGTEAEAKASS